MSSPQLTNNQINLGSIICFNCQVNGASQSPEFNNLNKMNLLHKMLDEIVQTLELTIVGESDKQFEPYGITICKVLSESHISIHTWPENNAFALDVYSCRDNLEQDKIVKVIEKYLHIENYNANYISRAI